MADVKIDLMLSDSGSINKKTGETKLLNQELTKTQKLARGVPLSSGQRRAPNGDMVNTEMERFSRARGTIGTGAAGRDFANQAQGLGGVVRLYATFAANIYAATAAFGALSRAMDTTNMVRGLDQLGAASGRNLGTLSKDLALASGGAFSLRDAMEATAKASAAGLTNQQITQLGDAAMKASQALGLNMPDALSRLSRGISKIEPELLDELGLFVKLEDATTEYARRLGKTASGLTEFERRQAFATAVLEQANQKFSNIDIDVNPYSKLLATLQNVLQTGLELVNKVLAPLVKYLSESPVALAGILGLIGVTLLKQVIPVIGEWRAGLRSAAEDAAKTAKSIKESFGDEFQARLESRFRIPDLQKSLKQTEEQIDKIQKKQATPGPVPQSLQRFASVTATDIDEKTIKNVEKLIATRKQYIETGLQGSRKLSQAAISDHAQDLTFLNQRLAALRQELQLKELIAQRTRQEASLQQAFGLAQVVADKPPGRLDPEIIQLKNYEAAVAKKDRLAAVSNAAENARVLGVRASWELLNKEIADNGTKGINKFTTLVQGGLTAVGTRIMGIVGSLSNVAIGIAAVVGAWELVNSVLSKNQKEAQATSQGFDKLRESAKFVDSVLTDISKRNPLGQISVEAINARATAFNELASSLEDQFNKIAKQAETAGWFDKFIDGFKQAVGKDLLGTSAREFSFSISQSFKLATEGLGKSRAIEAFKDAFKIDPTDRMELEKALVESPEKFLDLAPQLVSKMKEFGLELSNTASRGKELKDAFDAAEKTLKDFVTSALPTDPVAKFGAQLIDISSKLEQVLINPDTSLAALADISKSLSKQALLGNAGKQLAEYSAQIIEAVEKTIIFENALKRLAEQQAQNLEPTAGQDTLAFTQQQLATADLLNKSQQALKDNIQDLAKVLQDRTQLLAKAQEEALKRGTEFIRIGINSAFQKANLTIQSAFAERLGDTEAGIKARAEIEKRTNNLQLLQLQAQKLMLGSQSSLESEMSKLALEVEKNTLALKESKGIALSPAETERRTQIAQREELARRGQPQQLSSQQQLRLLAEQNLTAQMNQVAAQNIAVAVRTQDRLAENRLKIAGDILVTTQEELNTQKQLFDIQTKSQEFLTEEQIKRKDILEGQILENKLQRERFAIQENIDKQFRTLQDIRLKADDPQRQAAVEALQALGQEANRLDKRQDQERKRRNIDFYQFILENKEKEAIVSEKRSEFDKTTLELIEKRIALEKSYIIEVAEIDLEIRQKSFALTDKEVSQAKTVIAISKAKQEAEEKILQARKDYNAEISRISALAVSGEITGAQAIQQAMEADRLLKTTISNTNELRDKKIGLLSVDEEIVKSQKGMLDIYQQTFSKMGDSIVDFVKTGKLNFKSLVDDMLTQIARLYLNQIFANLFGSSLPFLPGTGRTGSTGAGSITGGSGFKLAKGGMFDRGVEKFGRGGTFTNSIVNSPTMFRFAKGTGLMGEAGPEAIMPLKRDSQGNLGVRGAGSNVEVVVNNYSQERAQAQETTDSRGNRRIEVTIGEMTAGEINRSGSATNRSMRGTFGLTPQLIRR